jgi:peptide/nickel transport system ATP-binding protein
VLERTCAFAKRCNFAEHACLARTPALQTLAGAREVRCRRTFELGVLKSAVGVVNADVQPRRSVAGPLLRVENLTCDYGERHRRWRAVDDVSLEIHRGEVVALVGESGSGKSTIARAIAGILRPRGGSMALDGSPLPSLTAKRSLRTLRDIQIIFQNPDSSLNPRHTVKDLVERAVVLFRPDVQKSGRGTVVKQMLHEVLLDPGFAGRYPHALSGGQRQRVAIARAFVAQPRLVICDEIVSGQDVSVQAAILELLRSMQRVHQTALLFISHDLAVVRSIAQRVYVMEKGRIKEFGTVHDVLSAPRDAYTQRLVSAVLKLEDAPAFA